MSAAVQDALDRTRLRVVDVDGVATRCFEAGEGEPLVLIHGGDFGSLYSLDGWSLNLPGLAARFRVLAFDKLGQGHTDNPRSDAEYTFDALISHAVGLVREMGLGPAHLVGHSMGALLAARIAIDHSELARSLVIVDSNTTAPDDPAYPWGAFYRELERRTPPGPPRRETVRLEPDAQAYSREHVTDDFVGRLYEIALLPKTQDAQRRMRTLRDAVWFPSLVPRRRQTLEEIERHGLPVPTLVVWGYEDVSAPYPLALRLFERVAIRTAEADLHLLAGAGHYCFRERPESFNRLIAGFCGS